MHAASPHQQHRGWWVGIIGRSQRVLPVLQSASQQLGAGLTAACRCGILLEPAALPRLQAAQCAPSLAGWPGSKLAQGVQGRLAVPVLSSPLMHEAHLSHFAGAAACTARSARMPPFPRLTEPLLLFSLSLSVTIPSQMVSMVPSGCHAAAAAAAALAAEARFFSSASAARLLLRRPSWVQMKSDASRRRPMSTPVAMPLRGGDETGQEGGRLGGHHQWMVSRRRVCAVLSSDALWTAHGPACSVLGVHTACAAPFPLPRRLTSR